MYLQERLDEPDVGLGELVGVADLHGESAAVGRHRSTRQDFHDVVVDFDEFSLDGGLPGHAAHCRELSE